MKNERFEFAGFALCAKAPLHLFNELVDAEARGPLAGQVVFERAEEFWPRQAERQGMPRDWRSSNRSRCLR